MIFDHDGNEIGRHQLEHEQILPRAGWVEHNPIEIWERTSAVVQTALSRTGLAANDLAALGITNQRETTVVWNTSTGRPYGNAIVWQDTRTADIVHALEQDGRGDVIRHRPACRLLRTSPAASCSGSCGRSTVSGRTQIAARRCSARSTAG